MKTTTQVIMTTTLDDADKAKELARQIVAARLAACVQLVPIHSVYRWKGAVEESPETLLVIKTRQDRADEVMQFIRKHHTYEVPEMTVMPLVGGWPEYLAWIDAESR
jgi:periplasmic divalent cation tolerance protein